jgi:hypothetical protein
VPTQETYRQQLGDLERDLRTVLSPKAIAGKFVELHGPLVVKAVIASAKAGIGPGNSPYPAYSDSYKRQLGMELYAGAEMFAKRLVKKAYWASRTESWERHAAGKKTISEATSEKRALAAGNKLWLYLSGKMLDPKNFSWRVEPSGRLLLVWTAPSPQVGIYAEAHNSGLPLGKNGPKKKREWMHFDTTLTMTAVVRGYEAAMRRLAEDFAGQWGKR